MYIKDSSKNRLVISTRECWNFTATIHMHQGLGIFPLDCIAAMNASPFSMVMTTEKGNYSQVEAVQECL